MEPKASSRIMAGGLVAICILSSTTDARGQEEVVDFESDRWVLKRAEVTEHLGRKCLSGAAYLKGVEFENGVIEVDIAVDGRRSYPGLVFRMQSQENYERFYVRPHRAGLYPDALQYTPVFNGVAGWQLYSGEGLTAPANIPADQWVPVRMEIHGTQARVFVNNAKQPSLSIPRLKHGLSKGSIGVLGPADGTAYFSQFSYRMDDTLEFEDVPVVETPRGTITDWEISRAFGPGEIDTESYPDFLLIFGAQWRSVTSEPSGLVDISRYVKRTGPEPNCVLAKAVVRSGRKRDIKLSFGYSDEVSIFLNRRKVFSGRSGYRSRDPSFVGVVGLNDDVNLTLQKGLNEILLMVTDVFGGWGFMCRTDSPLAGPVLRHDLVEKVWETPDVFKIPESVLYDPEREVLYVTSFDRLEPGHVDTGFISRVEPDGRIRDLHWVTGLDGPCGMGIHGNRLYVVEGFRANLVEIDVDSGKILKRYPFPGARFLNDLVIDKTGNIYISNTSISPRDKDIYRFRDGQIEIWKDGDEIHRSNGLFIHGDQLIVGSTGDGLLKSVDLADGKVSVIACLGGGVIDGIRVDSDGNYLVSHWEGQTYLVTPSGEVTQILDTMAAGLNIADFEFIKHRRLLIVPTFLGNKVVAYRVGAD